MSLNSTRTPEAQALILAATADATAAPAVPPVPVFAQI